MVIESEEDDAVRDWMTRSRRRSGKQIPCPAERGWQGRAWVLLVTSCEVSYLGVGLVMALPLSFVQGLAKCRCPHQRYKAGDGGEDDG